MAKRKRDEVESINELEKFPVQLYTKNYRENVISKLFDREYHYSSRIHPFVILNKFHKNFVPNFSVENTERPNCFLRKFTNDGRHLIAFGADITSVEIYEYQGPGAASHLLSGISSKRDSLDFNNNTNFIRTNIFNCFFKHKHSIKVSGNQLNRECSLFTDDNRFLIVVSSSFSNEATSSFRDRYQNSESLPINSRVHLEDYCLHLIDIFNGRISDEINFKYDKIYIPHNHGIYLYKNLLSILSVQHQTIYLYYILSSGKFVFTRKIGQFCMENDAYIYTRTVLNNNKKPMNWRTSYNVFYNSLKHRLLVFLFKRAKQLSKEMNSVKPIQQFYRDFDIYVKLRIWKLQLIDDEHILLKYDLECPLRTRPENLKSPNFFVIYNWKSAEILNVYYQYSDILLTAYENYCDSFRHTPGHQCSPSNNYYARRIYQDFKHSIIESKFTYKDAIRNLLQFLPHSAQSITTSPYLDFSLFSYDEKLICSFEKPRYTSDMPIRFYNRNTGKLLFRLHTGQTNYVHPAIARLQYILQNRRLIAFIFHPTDPFIISIQRYNSHFLLHFHIRHHNPM